MKKIILPYIILSMLLCSCSSTYYYATLGSTDPRLEKVENGDFLYQNDSLWIAHCFSGEDAPIQITVFNKLDVPLYVDWGRSALILNDIAYAYSDGATTHFEESESTSYDWWFGSTQTNTITMATTVLPQNISFIPPQTMISHQALRLSAQFDEINKKSYTKGRLATKNGETVEIQRINYDYENSPLHFDSFITVYTSPQKPQAYQSDFYATHLIKTSVKPQDLPADMGDRGDVFYQCKRPNNVGWHILGATAIVAGTVTLDVLISNDY